MKEFTPDDDKSWFPSFDSHCPHCKSLEERVARLENTIKRHHKYLARRLKEANITLKGNVDFWDQLAKELLPATHDD